MQPWISCRKITGQDGGKEAESGQSQPDDLYVQRSNGITCTISEATYTKKALYLALCLESEEAFPPIQERTGAVSGGELRAQFPDFGQAADS